MFTKLEELSWIKIEVARGRSRPTQECFQGLREACGDVALPYRTVAGWVTAFRVGGDFVNDNPRTGRPHVENNTVQLLASLLDVDRRWTARELAAEVGVCHKTVLHILHDNARCHTAAAVRDLLRRWQWEILEHPPYSPDVSPCDYDLFSKVKEPLRGNRYNTREAIIHAVGRSIWTINRNGRADGVRRLPNIWQKVINNAGDYIEGV
ncbi:hypothetical protein C0J52_23866 [Blattella germanica]|nr:hypothetical protein C0J52_23866 [Blattella germanica]